MRRRSVAALLVLHACCAALATPPQAAPSTAPDAPTTQQLVCLTPPQGAVLTSVLQHETHVRASDAFGAARPDGPPGAAACVRLAAAEQSTVSDCSLEMIDFLCMGTDAACVRMTADGRAVVRRSFDTPCLRQACLVRPSHYFVMPHARSRTFVCCCFRRFVPAARSHLLTACSATDAAATAC